jgi:competence protein ComEA
MVGGVIGGVLVLVAMVLTQQTRPAPIMIEPPPPAPTQAPTETPGPIHVYVSGEVVAADVYELPAGCIVADAIRRAGDFTAEAAVERVNLAQPLVDGMQIHVPRLAAEAETNQPVIQLPANALTGEGAAPDAGTGSFPVDINRAGAEALERLPGVGPATAAKIMAYREANGHFSRIEDIMEVSGIGEAKFEAMKDLITVGG